MQGADTPMFRQYLEIKAKVPDALLFYRMGDFYELFFDDAKEAAELLELTLTSRNKNDPDPIPMCGVPHHAAQAVPATARGRGTEGRDRRAGRDGRHVEAHGALARARRHARDSLRRRRARGARAVLARGGERRRTGRARVPRHLDGRPAGHRLPGRGRGLVGDRADGAEGDRRRRQVRSTAPRRFRAPTADSAWFDEAAATTALCRLLAVADLTGFGVAAGSSCIGAAGALVSYAREVARVDLSHVRTLVRYETDGHLVLDEATRRNLEILRPLRGSGRKGTLLHLLDGTRTSMGGRLLREWLTFPLTDVAAIDRRLDAVESLVPGSLRGELRESLRAVGDLDRLVGKASQGTANARDLVALRTSLEAAAAIAARVGEREILGRTIPEDLAADVVEDVARWLVDEPPAQPHRGRPRPAGCAQRARRAALARAGGEGRHRRDGSARARAHGDREPQGPLQPRVRLLHRGHAREQGQGPGGLAAQADPHGRASGTSRPSSRSSRTRSLGADERSNEIELDLFEALRERVASAASRIQAVARAIAVPRRPRGARRRRRRSGATCARVSTTSTDLAIRAGRHPVVEAMGGDERFVPNDVHLDARAPRRRADRSQHGGQEHRACGRWRSSCCSRRSGASSRPPRRASGSAIGSSCASVPSDDVAHGRSTFMVEMSETAGDPQPGDRALARAPRRDRARHVARTTGSRSRGPSPKRCTIGSARARSSRRTTTSSPTLADERPRGA